MSALVSLCHQFFCCFFFLFKFDEDGFKHLASTINRSYIYKKRAICLIIKVIFSNYREKILDLQPQRLLAVHCLNPEGERINGLREEV